MTVVAPPDPNQPDIVAKFAMARLRLVGSPWIRRAETPIAGLSGWTWGGTFRSAKDYQHFSATGR